MSYRVIIPAKIKDARGDKTIDEVVKKSGNAFTRGNLSAWENGHWKPSEKNIPALLKGLGCTYEDISSPIEEVERAGK